MNIYALQEAIIVVQRQVAELMERVKDVRAAKAGVDGAPVAVHVSGSTFTRAIQEDQFGVEERMLYVRFWGDLTHAAESVRVLLELVPP